jgi:hypothetical protein
MTNVAHSFDLGIAHLLAGAIFWKSGAGANYTYKMALYNSSQTFVQATNTTYAALGVTNELATALGYTRGGQTMTITSASKGTGDTVVLGGNDVVWTGSPTPCTFTTVRSAVIYEVTTGYLVSYITWDAPDKAGQGGTFTITAPATGWVTLTDA